MKSDSVSAEYSGDSILCNLFHFLSLFYVCRESGHLVIVSEASRGVILSEMGGWLTIFPQQAIFMGGSARKEQSNDIL